MKKALFLFFFFLSFASIEKVFALATATVTNIKGEVTFKGENLRVGEVIQGVGNLVTQKKSFIKIYVEAWNNTIVLGPSSTMKLNLTKEEKVDGDKIFYTLSKGICRWVSTKDSKKQKGAVHTPIASLGVRGTDFLVKQNSLLGETEIVVFDGKVLFKNRKLKNDEIEVNKGQWGGLGGRFGKTIGEILDLPPKVIERFKKTL